MSTDSQPNAVKKVQGIAGSSPQVQSLALKESGGGIGSPSDARLNGEGGKKVRRARQAGEGRMKRRQRNGRGESEAYRL